MRGTTVMSTVRPPETSTVPSSGTEPDVTLLAAKNSGALKLWPPSLSLTRRRRIGTPARRRTCSGLNAKLDNRIVIAAISGARTDWDQAAAGADVAIARNRAATLCRMQYVAYQPQITWRDWHGLRG